MNDTTTALTATQNNLVGYGETQGTAAAATAKALVEARYVVAYRRPRNWDQVRQEVLAECRRPGFAENKSVLYHKPIGDGVEGLGIRFVEAALRRMTNVFIDTTTTYDDDLKEIVHVSVTDLEANVPWGTDITVRKTVERSKPLDDGSYLSVRTNSRGKAVYTIPATDEDLLNKRGALISKAIRTLGLRVIPGDIQDEAEELIRKIRNDKAAEDPGAERKRILDAFFSLNIKAPDLQEFLGFDVGACTPADLVKLRGLYGAIRDGQVSWADTIEEVRAKREQSTTSRINEEIRAKAVSVPASARKPDDVAGATVTGAAASSPPHFRTDIKPHPSRAVDDIGKNKQQAAMQESQAATCPDCGAPEGVAHALDCASLIYPDRALSGMLGDPLPPISPKLQDNDDPRKRGPGRPRKDPSAPSEHFIAGAIDTARSHDDVDLAVSMIHNGLQPGVQAELIDRARARRIELGAR